MLVTRQVEEKKHDLIPEEEQPSTNKADELLSLSSIIIDKLQTLGSMDEAKLLMANVLFEIKSINSFKLAIY